MSNFISYIINLFKYTPQEDYTFNLSPINKELSNNQIRPLENLNQAVYQSSDVNLEPLIRNDPVPVQKSINDGLFTFPLNW